MRAKTCASACEERRQSIPRPWARAELVANQGSLAGRDILFHHRAAPSRQIIRDAGLGEPHCFFERTAKILLDQLSFDAAAQEIGPEKLGKRNGFLCEPA